MDPVITTLYNRLINIRDNYQLIEPLTVALFNFEILGVVIHEHKEDGNILVTTSVVLNDLKQRDIELNTYGTQVYYQGELITGIELYMLYPQISTDLVNPKTGRNFSHMLKMLPHFRGCKI